LGGLLKQGGSDRESAVLCPGGGVIQCGGQTCPAVFVRLGRGSPSCAWWWRAKAADRGEDGALHRAGDGDLGQLAGQSRLS